MDLYRIKKRDLFSLTFRNEIFLCMLTTIRERNVGEEKRKRVRSPLGERLNRAALYNNNTHSTPPAGDSPSSFVCCMDNSFRRDPFFVLCPPKGVYYDDDDPAEMI